MEKYCVCLGGSNIVVDAEFQAITKKAILQCFEDGFKTFLQFCVTSKKKEGIYVFNVIFLILFKQINIALNCLIHPIMMKSIFCGGGRCWKPICFY